VVEQQSINKQQLKTKHYGNRIKQSSKQGGALRKSPVEIFSERAGKRASNV